jgi:hypothetical protein
VNCGTGTVFVLGAGFTKAFFPKAPLLVDDYEVDELKRQFTRMPHALSLLDMELANTDHPPGQINLERLMTRLAGGMPYDIPAGAHKQFALLLSSLKQKFVWRVLLAREPGCVHPGELWLFAAHCFSNELTCVTFNYDDFLDEILWSHRQFYDPAEGWTPDWGYGFPCAMSESAVRNVTIGPGKPSRMLLLKLHGSVNWRILLGHSGPFAVDAVRHHEEWFQHHVSSKIPLDHVEPFLEDEPFLVPPVLTKTDLVEQPILRLVWTLAVKALARARRVVFIGYSLPITDIAAGFLFREALQHLDPSKDITVVNFAESDAGRQSKEKGLIAAYQSVFPSIKPDRFDFSGAETWVRENLTQWLYNSRGIPVAFRALDEVVSRDGKYIGRVVVYVPGRYQIWHGTYRGEIVDGNRLLSTVPPPEENRGGSNPPTLPQVPRIPANIAPIALADGFRDAELPAS